MVNFYETIGWCCARSLVSAPSGTQGRRSVIKTIVGILILAVGGSLARGAQVSATWDGSSGAWTDSERWGLAAPLYPDNSIDPSTSYVVSVSGGSVTLNELSPTLDQLDLTGGAITGSGTLTLENAFNWSGANIGIASLIAKGTVNLSPASGPLPNYIPSLVGTAFTLEHGATFNLSLPGFTQPFNFQQNASFTNNGLFNVLVNATLTGYPAGVPGQKTDGHFVNNGTLTIQNGLGISSTISFDNAGLIQVLGGFFIPASLVSSPTSSVVIGPHGRLLDIATPITTGTLSNAGTITINYNGPATTTLGGAGLHFSNAGMLSIGDGLAIIGDTPIPVLPMTLTSPTASSQVSTFINTGTTAITGGLLHLFAAQDPATNGSFAVDQHAVLEFAANYDFSTATGPTLTGSGLVIIDPGVTLTLAADTAFAGTIQIDGTLLIAPPLDADADAASLLRFTVIDSPVPEPASLVLLTAGTLPLLSRRRRK